jgi:aspartate racemase
MKTVGILGGIGPESTIEYYRSIIASYRERAGDRGYPSIIINSIDVNQMLGLIGANRLAEVGDYLAGELQRLVAAGADFAVLAANTPHIVFGALSARIPIPLISIVDATCEAARACGLKRVGLFGTRFTMQARFYLEAFGQAGIAVVLPSPEAQAYIHDKYMGELIGGRFLPETREGLLAIVELMKAREGIEGIILGGTELPLILREGTYSGVRFLDTTKIHVEAIVSRLLS